MISNLEVKENILEDAKYMYLFSVEAVNELVNKGVPFRDAYKQVGDAIENGTFQFDHSKSLNHTHEGSIGNLCLEDINNLMQATMHKFNDPLYTK
jgi:argininosuccinate lyase